MKKLTNFINEAEKSKKQKEYQEFFDKKLKKFDVKSPAELSDADKKKFFNEIDKEWTQEPTNEKQVEEDYDSEEDDDSKKMKAKKESYESKDKGKDKEELYSSEDEEVEESEDDEMEEDSYNESSKKKVNEAKKIKEKDAKKRLEQIRQSLRREDLSYGEIAELEALSDFIEADDIELRQAAGLPEAEYDMDGNILEHEKGDTAEISVTKSEMEKLHKDGKIDIDKDGVIFSLVFKHDESMHEAKLNESKKDILNTLNDLAATLYDKKDKRHKMIGDFIDKMEDQFTIRELSSLHEAKLNEDGYAEGSIKEALALLAGSTNKRDKQIMKLLRSALKDLY